MCILPPSGSIKSIKKHYVYLYRSPVDGTPIYVGKGWGKRAWSHLAFAKNDPDKHRNKYFSRKLSKWLREGFNIQPEIIAEFDTHEEALDKEAQLIAEFGRINRGNGTLLNLTDGGEGTVGKGVIITVNGQVFPSYREAALIYGLEEGTVRNRVNILGYTIEQALGICPAPQHLPKNTKPINVAGVDYSSIAEACRRFGISEELASARLNRTDWNLEQIFGIEPPPLKHGPNSIAITVCEQEFSSLIEACKTIAPHIKADTIKARINPKGWTIEQAFELEPPPNNKVGPKNPVIAFGKNYCSISEAAKDFGIHKDTVYWRVRKLSWTLEAALTMPVEQKYIVGDKTFNNFSEACAFYGLGRVTVKERLRRGWDVTKAFNTPARKLKSN